MGENLIHETARIAIRTMKKVISALPMNTQRMDPGLMLEDDDIYDIEYRVEIITVHNK